MRGILRRIAGVSITLLLFGPLDPGWHPVAAAPPSIAVADYVGLLEDSLDAISAQPPDVDRARAPIEGLVQGSLRSAGYNPAPALQPVLDALNQRPSNLADASRRLHTLIETLRVQQQNTPPHDVNDAVARLHEVYQSPSFRDLDAPPQSGWIARLGESIRRFFDSVTTPGRSDPSTPGGTGPSNAGLVIVILALISIIAATAWWIVRTRQHQTGMVEPAGTTSNPDAEWDAACHAAASGAYREAIRRSFRSALLAVARHGRLAVDPSWTTRELLVRASADSDLLTRLTPAADRFQIAWYSGMPVTEADWVATRDHCAGIRALADATTAASR